jgi:hypothetical protein
VPCDPVGDLELEVLRADAFFEGERGAAPVIAVDRTLAGEESHQLVLADFLVAEVDAVHAALQQGVRFAGRVQIVGHLLVVDLDRDGVEREERAHVHRQEHGDLGIGRKQQLLLENEQILVQIDDVFLQPLHFLIQRSELGRRRFGAGCRCGGRGIGCGRGGGSR